jgi:hypothetical protein
MDDTNSDGHMTRLMGFLGIPFREQHSLSGWIMLLALGLIAVFIWTRILKYVKGE